MFVRLATMDDLDAIVELWHGLIAHHQPLNPRLYEIQSHSAATYRTFVSRKITGDVGLVTVAQTPTGIAGYLVGAQGQRSPVYAVRSVGMIYDLAVDKTYRRQGIARAMVNYAQSAFLASGIDDIQVNYAPQNREAAAFWASLGYEVLLVEAYRSCRGP